MLTPHEFRELTVVRAALEESAAREAALALAGEVHVLEREIDAMVFAAATGDTEAVLAHDVEFHRRLVLASGNARLAQVWVGLQLTPDVVRGFVSSTTDLVAFAADHWAILDSLRARDPRRAGTAVRQHLEAEFQRLAAPRR